MKTQKFLTVALIVFAMIITAVAYNKLPATVPSHWNINGDIDGYLSKSSHIVLFLVLSIGLPLLLNWAPKLDPKHSNIKGFENAYQWFIVSMTGFIVALYIFVTASALGYSLPIQNFIIPAMALLFYAIGVMLKQTKSNYTIGFKLPWTLHSEKNWDMTHAVAARSFKYGATALVLSLLFGTIAFPIFMVTLSVMVIVPVVYSYTLHRRGI